MSVAPGTTIGPYEVDREIGRGGMGVVYLARDTRLHRNVAIKALPEHLASDAGRLERFEREARTLAQLSNPNVAGIFGVEEQDGGRYLILEHVRGDTLADRLAAGPLPVAEALDLATGIASGIQAAHEAGVVHRDLKPANIKITPEGTVKVLDFGLAKTAAVTAEEATSESPTMTAHAGQSPTIPGAILGTAPYMSPEQARGRPVDKRSDIWSFGVVLYEMLTGRVPFAGETATDAIGAILHQEVEYARLPAHTPANVRLVLRRCLARKAGERFESMGDIGILLGESGAADAADAAVAAGASAGERRGPSVLVASILLLGALAFAAGLWTRGLVTERSATLARTGVVFDLELPDNQVIEWRGTGSMMAKVGIAPMIDIAPDGTRVVYAAHTGGTTALYVRELDDVTIRELPGTAGTSAGVRQSARAPFFSPDGEWVAFVANETLQKVRLAGGMPQPIGRLSSTSVDGEWSPDGRWIFYASDSGLWRVPADGGTAEQLTAPDPQRGEIAHFFPHLVHGGNAVLFTVISETGPNIALLDVATREWTTVFRNASDARPCGEGRVVFARGRGLLTMPVEPDDFTPGGEAIPLAFASDVHITPGLSRAVVTHFAVADDALVFLPSPSTEQRDQLTWVDREGNETVLTEGPGRWMHPRLSPNGERVLFDKQTDEGRDLHILELATGQVTRLTFNGATFDAEWTPDGASIISIRTGPPGRVIERRPTDFTDVVERLADDPGGQMGISDISPDGSFALFTDKSLNGIWISSLEQPTTPQRLIATERNERWGVLSADGEWIAYVADESGRREVFVQPYPGPGPRTRVSLEGGGEPVWSPDGDELFFRQHDTFFAASFEISDRFVVKGVVPLFTATYDAADHQHYDVAADGRFLVVKHGQALVRRMQVRLGWNDEPE